MSTGRVRMKELQGPSSRSSDTDPIFLCRRMKTSCAASRGRLAGFRSKNQFAKRLRLKHGTVKGRNRHLHAPFLTPHSLYEGTEEIVEI